MRNWIYICVALAAVSCGKDETNNDPRCGPTERCAEDMNIDPGTDAAGGDDTGRMPNNVPDMGVDPDPDMPGSDDVGVDMSQPPSCERTPRPENGPRKVVVALPFTDTMYEVFDLDAAGELTRPGTTFAMGAGHEGEILFTPDGEVGFAVQEGGTLGVFRINAAGQPEVLAGSHDPGFFVSGVAIDATGDNLYAWETGFRKLDDGTANGALYRLPIACATGLPGAAEEVLRTKLMRAASWLTPTRLAIGAVDLLDDETSNDVHLVDLDGPTRAASASAFDDEDAITAGFATTHDGNYVLIGDNSAFSGVPNRVGVVGIQGDQLFPQQTLEIDDPVAIVASPFNNAAIVLSTMGDEIVVLDYNPGAAVSAFSIRGPLTTTAPVLLPLSAAMVEAGDLEGVVLIGENVGVRRVRFEQNGDVTDLGLFELGDGVASITGAIGVQP